MAVVQFCCEVYDQPVADLKCNSQMSLPDRAGSVTPNHISASAARCAIFQSNAAVGPTEGFLLRMIFIDKIHNLTTLSTTT